MEDSLTDLQAPALLNLPRASRTFHGSLPLPLAALVATTLACGCKGSGEARTSPETYTVGPLTVVHVLVPEPALGDRAAMYLTVINDGPEDEVVDVSLEGAGRATLHRSEMREGVMSMRQVSSFVVPQHDTLHLRPGGWHIMLEELGRPLRVGERRRGALLFRNGVRLDFQARVVSYNELEATFR